MSELETLMAQLEQRKAEKQAELSTLKQTITAKHELRKLDSPLYAQREMAKSDNLTLDTLLEQVAETYARENRKVSQVFGYGLLPSKILTLLKAIQYTKADDRTELLMLTGLDEQTIEDTIDAFGATPYFSKQTISIVPAIAMDLPRIKELLTLVATDMALVSELDLSKFNIDNVRYQYERAQASAEEMLENTQELTAVAIAYEE